MEIALLASAFTVLSFVCRSKIALSNLLFLMTHCPDSDSACGERFGPRRLLTKNAGVMEERVSRFA